jgi:hypothetical protein
MLPHFHLVVAQRALPAASGQVGAWRVIGGALAGRAPEAARASTDLPEAAWGIGRSTLNVVIKVEFVGVRA